MAYNQKNIDRQIQRNREKQIKLNQERLERNNNIFIMIILIIAIIAILRVVIMNATFSIEGFLTYVVSIEPLNWVDISIGLINADWGIFEFLRILFNSLIKVFNVVLVFANLLTNAIGYISNFVFYLLGFNI